MNNISTVFIHKFMKLHKSMRFRESSFWYEMINKSLNWNDIQLIITTNSISYFNCVFFNFKEY